MGHSLLVGFFTAIAILTQGTLAQTSISQLSYKIVEQWNIPNGGSGKTIVVNKSNPTEQELRALGEKLKQDTKYDRNAFIFVYDDEQAARNRLAAISERLNKTEIQHHDQHRIAQYFRNINTGFHELVITPKGLNGPSVRVKY